MTFESLIDYAWMLACRLAGYVTLNWADDAAMLAIVFC
jgi:hypothetical protein